MQDSSVYHGHSNSKAKTSSRCASPSLEGLLGRRDETTKTAVVAGDCAAHTSTATMTTTSAD